MRSADALEKISRKHPDWPQPYKRQLLTQVAHSEQQEVCWHVAQLFPRLAVDPEERTAMVRVLLDYLTDKSQIVKVCALQVLADLSAHDPCFDVRLSRFWNRSRVRAAQQSRVEHTNCSSN
jgi:phosphatidylinositol kinase/protein kinase (PI-3  family)